MTRTISTTIRDGIYEEIKKAGWAFNDLLELGFERRKNMAQENARINLMEEQLIEQKALVQKWIQKTYLLQEELSKKAEDQPI